MYGWIWKRAGERGRKRLEWGLAALVAVVSAASVLTHEPWADELHAWLQAKQLTLGELWQEMAYEGHFVPWHWILHPFARWGAPVETMGWISWGINAATVAWFARKAPLGGWAKAAAALSCVFLYVNPAISRPYVLVPPVLFGLAASWQKRDERPVAFGLLVALLANTHVCMAGTAGLVFAVFAWENVLRRADGKRWRECGRQWAGLGVMAAGGAVALAQILPSLWKSGLEVGVDRLGLGSNVASFFMGCSPAVGWAFAVAGMVALGVEAWRRDKGLFWVYAGSFAYFIGFSVFLYSARIINRAMVWWPLAVGVAWALTGRDGKSGRHGRIGMSVALVGMGLMRPDMTRMDWSGEFDSMKGACLSIAERNGRDAEVWIEGHNFLVEGAAAYLDNLWDLSTGRKAERVRLQKGWENGSADIEELWDEVFRSRPGQESLRVLALYDNGSGERPHADPSSGIEIEYCSGKSAMSVGTIVLKVSRGTPRERGSHWGRTAMERLAAGDRAGGEAALERAVSWDPGQWVAMNNLAWLCVEAGRVAEARAWMDRALANEDARNNAGVWDTEAAVRRAEGNEEGARDAERRRDGLKNAE